MKIKAPLPEFQVIGDEDKEEDEVLYLPRVNDVVENKVPVSNTLAAIKMQTYYQQGLCKRAIVCRKNEDILNPMYWGIIIDVHIYTEYPLEVCWVNTGVRALTKGDDLVVIYRGMSAMALQDYFDLNKKSKQ